MNIRIHLRTLTAAAVLAVAVIGVAGESVHAESKEDNGVRCAAHSGSGGDNEWNFYLPGEIITVIDSNGVGHKMECGADGRWHEVNARPPTSRPIPPQFLTQQTEPLVPLVPVLSLLP